LDNFVDLHSQIKFEKYPQSSYYQSRSGFVVQDWNPKFRPTHFRIKSVETPGARNPIDRWTEITLFQDILCLSYSYRSSVTIYLNFQKVFFFSSLFSALIVMLVIMILCKESWWTCGAAFGRRDQPDGDVGHCRSASYTLVWERSRAVAWPFLWTSRYKALRGICYHGDNKLWHHDVILWRPALERAALSKFGALTAAWSKFGVRKGAA